MQSVLSQSDIHLVPVVAPDIEAEDMALRKEQQDFIRDEIKRQLEIVADQFNPRGWRKFLYLAREWGVLGTIATVIVALLAVAAGAIYQATARIGKESTFEANTERDLKEIGKELIALRALLSSAQPTRVENQEAVKKLLVEAKEKSILLPQSVLQEAANNFIQAGKSDPNAWNVALSFLDYRSLFNIAPNFDIKTSEPLHTRYQFLVEEGGIHPTLYFSTSTVLRGQAAVLEQLGHPTNSGNPYGNAYLVVEGGDVVLDSLNMKNIVFQNSRVHYGGHQVLMENVYFINCTFDIVREPNGQVFANNVLATSSSSVTFHIG